jgi:hypothetical protein
MFGKRQQSDSAECGELGGWRTKVFFLIKKNTHAQSKLCEEVHCKVDKPVFQVYEGEEYNI